MYSNTAIAALAQRVKKLEEALLNHQISRQEAIKRISHRATGPAMVKVPADHQVQQILEDKISVEVPSKVGRHDYNTHVFVPYKYHKHPNGIGIRPATATVWVLIRITEAEYLTLMDGLQ